MTYNALDIALLAKELREQLVLEEQDLRSSLSYEHATSWCSDCPRKEREPQSYSEQEFGVHYASTCCKDDEQWEKDHEGDYQTQEAIKTLIQAISQYLGLGG
jgi:hypothetical protein